MNIKKLAEPRATKSVFQRWLSRPKKIHNIDDNPKIYVYYKLPDKEILRQFWACYKTISFQGEENFFVSLYEYRQTYSLYTLLKHCLDVATLRRCTLRKR